MILLRSGILWNCVNNEGPRFVQDNLNTKPILENTLGPKKELAVYYNQFRFNFRSVMGYIHHSNFYHNMGSLDANELNLSIHRYCHHIGFLMSKLLVLLVMVVIMREFLEIKLKSS